MRRSYLTIESAQRIWQDVYQFEGSEIGLEDALEFRRGSSRMILHTGHRFRRGDRVLLQGLQTHSVQVRICVKRGSHYARIAWPGHGILQKPGSLQRVSYVGELPPEFYPDVSIPDTYAYYISPQTVYQVTFMDTKNLGNIPAAYFRNTLPALTLFEDGRADPDHFLVPLPVASLLNAEVFMDVRANHLAGIPLEILRSPLEVAGEGLETRFPATLDLTGGGAITLRKISRIVPGSCPGHDRYRLDRAYNNIIGFTTVCTIFPQTYRGFKNEQLSWKVLNTGDQIYCLDIPDGYYSLDDLSCFLEESMDGYHVRLQYSPEQLRVTLGVYGSYTISPTATVAHCARWIHPHSMLATENILLRMGPIKADGRSLSNMGGTKNFPEYLVYGRRQGGLYQLEPERWVVSRNNLVSEYLFDDRLQEGDLVVDQDRVYLVEKKDGQKIDPDRVHLVFSKIPIVDVQDVEMLAPETEYLWIFHPDHYLEYGDPIFSKDWKLLGKVFRVQDELHYSVRLFQNMMEDHFYYPVVSQFLFGTGSLGRKLGFPSEDGAFAKFHTGRWPASLMGPGYFRVTSPELGLITLVKLTEDPGNMLFDAHVPIVREFDHPIPLGSLEINCTYPDGEPVDFQGLDYLIIFEMHEKVT